MVAYVPKGNDDIVLRECKVTTLIKKEKGEH